MSDATVVELARAMREVQMDYRLDEISAMMVLPTGSITIRFTGLETPLGVLENEKGYTVAIDVP
jgi:hypothetical protein